MRGTGPRKKTPPTSASLLRRLDRIKAEYADGKATEKRRILTALRRRTLAMPRDIGVLHEALCFLQAYPDDADTLNLVEALLAAFSRRADPRRHLASLADSGITGTDIHYRFYWAMAKWLAHKWPQRLSIQWSEFEHTDALERLLSLLALHGETPGLDECPLELRDWIRRMKGQKETDASFVVERFEKLPVTEPVRERMFEELDIPMRLAGGPDTPSRSLAKWDGAKIVYQSGPLRRGRPETRDEIMRPPRSIRAATPAEARRLLDLARSALVTRSRDLDIFSYGDPNDMRLIDAGDGLMFVYIGFLPERRLMLEAFYGFLLLKNGVPIAYGGNSALYGSAEIAFNIFESFRGAETAWIYLRYLSVVRHLFQTDTFTIYPYQLGEDNKEALQSGAWWFYRKLGFAPKDPAARRIAQREEQRMKRQPGHRSTIRTLEVLAAHNLYLHLDKERDDVIGELALGGVGLAVTDLLARRFGSDREAGERACAEEAADMLGVSEWSRWPAGQRLWWKRWSPLLLALPGASRWTVAQKKSLVNIVRAKGGPRELAFAVLFDRHVRLRESLLQLAAESNECSVR